MGYGVAWWTIVGAVILAYVGILSAIKAMDVLNKKGTKVDKEVAA